MHALLQSMTARLLLAAAGSALVALFVFVVNPFPSGVYGQQGPSGGTTPNTATQPVTERTTTTEVLPVTTAPAANTTTSPATGSAAAAPVVPIAAPARQVTVAQQPVALPRTGTGLDADTEMSTGAAYGFLALAAALTAAAVVHRLRRAR